MVTLFSPNMFQQLVRAWDEVHPYNAAQVLTLAGSPDVDAINAAWHQSLEAMGLGLVRESYTGFRYEILNGEAHLHPVRLLPPETCLADYLSRSMNQRFDPAEPPFRPFLLPAKQGYQLGLVYQHWIADSVSIRFLLREWCGRLFDAGLCREQPARFQHDGYWRLYGPPSGRVRVDQAFLELWRSHMRFRTVRKVKLPPHENHDVQVLLRPFPTGLIRELRVALRKREATVGDALQAALAIACGEHVPLQSKPGRRDLGIGNIVDLRKQAGRDLSDAFGFYLGFTHVVCRRQDLNSFYRLLQSIRRQNLARRREGVAQHSLASLVAALIAERVGRPKNCYRLYRKEIPLAAGLSNVNLEGLWPERLSPTPLRAYARISPTGPMTPLVLTTTTLAGEMQMALTWRRGLFADEEAPRVLDRVIGVLAGQV